MTYHQLRCFVEVAERLSFTAAAESLYMAQSTLSRQIALLEEEFGMAFFIRDKGGLTMTQAGEIFYEEAKTTLVRERQLRARLDNAKHGKPELLRIGIMEETWPPEAVRLAVGELRRVCKDVDLLIRPLHVHDIYMQLESGAVDVVCTNDHAVASVPNVVQVPVCTEPMYLAASKYYPLVKNGQLKLEDISEIIARREYMVLEPSLFGQQMVPRLRQLLSHSLCDAQLDQLRYMRSDTHMAMQVMCGVGATMVHKSHRLCSAPGIVLTPVPEDVEPLHLVLAYRNENDNPAVPIFMELVQKYLAEDNQ